MKTKETPTQEINYVELFAKDYEVLKSSVTMLARHIETIKSLNAEIDELIHEAQDGTKSSREVATELHDKQEALAGVEQEYKELCAMIDRISTNRKVRLNEIKQIMRGDKDE